MYALDTKRAMTGHYKKTSSQSAHTIVAIYYVFKKPNYKPVNAYQHSYSLFLSASFLPVIPRIQAPLLISPPKTSYKD